MDSLDEIRSWNSGDNVAVLHIYTDLTLEKVEEYFTTYRKGLLQLYPDEHYIIAYTKTEEDPDDAPDYLIDTPIPDWHESQERFRFTPTSAFITSTIFQNKSDRHDRQDINHLMDDPWFSRIRHLRKTLKEDYIPHYLVLELKRHQDPEITEFPLGGVTKEGTPYMAPESANLIYTQLFTKDERQAIPAKRHHF